MSKGNLPVVVRLEDRLRERLQDEVAIVNRRRPKLEYSLSQFIREAIVEKLSHKERSKKARARKLYECRFCHVKKPLSSIVTYMKLLTGEKEYTCVACEFATPTKNSPPN